MPSETGWWSQEEAKTNHDFCYELARWMGDYIPKKDVVIDMGCGIGQYLRYLHDRAFENLLGLEGEIPKFNHFGNIHKQDLTKAFVKDPTGYTICLEVGEHIPEKYLPIFLDNIVNNTSKRLIMSWAVPLQDGYGHVSCRHNIWVINEMEKRGMKFNASDSLDTRSVITERWSYFRNTLMIFEK